MKCSFLPLLATVLALATAGLRSAFAPDVPPLGTNSINGLVRFTNAHAGILQRLGPPGNEGMSAFVVIANSEPPDALGAAKQFVPGDPLSHAYDLTVAASDTPLIYSVYAVLTLDGVYEEYYTETHIAAPLTSNSPPVTVDIEECVALLELRYEDPLGQPVAALGGRALVTEVATGVWRARYLTQPPGRTGNFLAVPTGVEIELAVEVDTGTDIYLDQVQAEIQFGGGHRFQYFITPALGYGSCNPGAEVTAGNDTDLGDTFVMNPARLVGRLTLEGPPDFAGQVSALRGLVRSSDFDDDMDGIPDYVGITGINGSYAIVTGVDELAPGATRAAAGGQATVSFAGAFNPLTAAFEGDYEAIVGMLNDEPGVWKYDGLNLVFDHPGTTGGPFVNETLYVFEDEPWQDALAPGERATNDVYYGFAEVCLRIQSPAPFFCPRVVNTYGSYTNYGATGNILNSYRVILGNASAPPYTADTATNEAVVTCHVPQGRYTLQPAISIVDPDGGVSETQLPAVEISVTAGERYCVEECIRVFIEPPVCTTNFGFLGWGNAVSLCGQILTNISVTIRPLSDRSIRLGYSEQWLSAYATNEMRMPGQVFPEFDGYDPSLHENMVWTVVARDNLGHVATRQMTIRYDFIAPVLNGFDLIVVSANGIDAVVDFNLTVSSDGILVWEPPSGSTFPIGTTLVTCIARDLCHNTNTCAFSVTVEPLPAHCRLHMTLTPDTSPTLTFTWDCGGTLQCASDRLTQEMRNGVSLSAGFWRMTGWIR